MLRTLGRIIEGVVRGALSAIADQCTYESSPVIQNLNAKADGEFYIENTAGDIEINAGGNTSAEISYKITARGETEEKAKELAEKTRVVIDGKNGRIDVKVLHSGSNSWGHNVSVHFNVTLPQNTAVYAKSVSGSIAFRGIKGNTDANTVSGNIVALSAGSHLNLHSVSGNIDVTGGTGKVNMQTTSGWVKVQDIFASHLRVNSVSGDIDLQGSLADKVDANLRSVSGSIALKIPRESRIRFEGKTVSGTLKIDIPATYKLMEKRHLTADINEPLGSVYAETTSGNVSLS